MATKINYVDEVWNPVVGCTKCSPGCLNCYAEKMALRLASIGAAQKAKKHQFSDIHLWKKYSSVLNWGENKVWNGEIFCDEEALDKPLHWRKPRRILCCSMGDLFHEKMPFEFIHKVFAVMSLCPQHTFMLLTKRIDVVAEYINKKRRWPDDILPQVDKITSPYNSPCEYWWPLSNVQIGVTICNQAEADEKIPILLQIQAAHRWISFEPLLGEIDARIHLLGKCGYYCDERVGHVDHTYIDFAVIGCESGPNRRPCKRERIKSLYDQCKAAGVEVMVKQMAENEDGTGKICHDPEAHERKLAADGEKD